MIKWLKGATPWAGMVMVGLSPFLLIVGLLYYSWRCDDEWAKKNPVTVTLTLEPELEHINQTSGTYSSSGPCTIRLRCRDKQEYDEIRELLLDLPNVKRESK